MNDTNCEQHKMEFVGSGEYYIWQEDDMLTVENRETYECGSCGLIDTIVEDAA